MKNFKMMSLAIVAMLTFSVTGWAQDAENLDLDSIVVAPDDVDTEDVLEAPSSVVSNVTDEVVTPSVEMASTVEGSVGSVVTDCVGCGQVNQVVSGCQSCNSCGGVQQAAVVSPCQACGQVGMVAYQQSVMQPPVVAPNSNSIVTSAPAPYVPNPTIATPVYSTGNGPTYVPGTAYPSSATPAPTSPTMTYGPTTNYAQSTTYAPTTTNYTPSTNYAPATTGCSNCGTTSFNGGGVSYGSSSFGGRTRGRLGSRVGGRVFRRN